MKTTRILSLIFTLCMAVSVFAVGMVDAFAVDETEESESVKATETLETDAVTEATSEVVTEPTTEATEQSAKKWYGLNHASQNLTSEEATIFAAAVGLLQQGDLTIIPIDVMTKQNSSGKTYAYLTTVFDNCNSANAELERKKKIWGNSIYSDPAVMQEYVDAQNEFFEKVKNAVSWWVYIVNVDSAGNATYVNKEQIDLNDIKTSDTTSGDWIITAKEPNADDIKGIQSAVKNEIANYSDVDLKIIAQIAERSGDNGDDYLLMCYGTKDSKTDLYVVEMHNTGTNQEIAKVSIFDLAAYAAAVGNNSTTASNAANINNSGNNSATAIHTANNSNSGNSGASSTVFPNTGQENTHLYIVITVLFLLAAVIFFACRRKRT